MDHSSPPNWRLFYFRSGKKHKPDRLRRAANDRYILIIHASVVGGWVKHSVASVISSVCLFVRILKGKLLELSTTKSVSI